MDPRLRTQNSELRTCFSFPVFLGALLVAAAFLNLCLRLENVASLPAGQAHASFVEGDTFWHIAVGQRILATHTWPTTNFYSFTTPQTEWLAYEWLGEVTMALVARLGWPRPLMGLLVALVSTILLLVYYYAYLRSGNVKTAFVACAAVLPLLCVCFSLRPQLLAYIFLLITLICLERYRRGVQRGVGPQAKADSSLRSASFRMTATSKCHNDPAGAGEGSAFLRLERTGSLLWLLPVVFVLWVNTHGTFLFGLLAIGVYWLGGVKDFRVGNLEGKSWTPSQRRHLGSVFILCILVLPLNPYGLHLIRYELSAISQPVNLTYFEEWQPLAFNESFGKWFLVLLLLYLLAVVALDFSQRAEDLALVLFAAYMACVHQRFVVFFAVVLAPVLATLLAKWMPKYEPAKDKPLLNASLIMLFAAAIVGLFPSTGKLERVIDLNQPRRAVGYLRQHPVPGPMLNDNFWGGYLIWARGPEYKVFIDGRCDAYEPSGVLSDYVKIVLLDRQALPVLEKYGVRSCLIQRSAPLCTLLDALPEWRRVYEDDLSVVYVKDSHRNTEALRSAEF